MIDFGGKFFKQSELKQKVMKPARISRGSRANDPETMLGHVQVCHDVLLGLAGDWRGSDRGGGAPDPARPQVLHLQGPGTPGHGLAQSQVHWLLP